DYLLAPDGRTLYVEVDNGSSERHRIYRVNGRTGASRDLGRPAAEESDALCGISPDGKALYVTRTRNRRSASEIITLDPRRKKTRTLLKSGDQDRIRCKAAHSRR